MRNPCNPRKRIPFPYCLEGPYHLCDAKPQASGLCFAETAETVNTAAVSARMALKTGICNNVTSCDLAYRKQPITTEQSAFCCPECGQPLHKLEPKFSEGRILMMVVRVLVIAFIFGVGGFLVGTR